MKTDDAAAQVLVKRRRYRSEDKLFPTRNETWVNPGNVERLWRDTTQGTSFEDVRIHDLLAVETLSLDESAGLDPMTSGRGSSSIKLASDAE